MVHIGGRQHGASNMPRVLNVNHHGVGINGTAIPSNVNLWVGVTQSASYQTRRRSSGGGSWYSMGGSER